MAEHRSGETQRFRETIRNTGRIISKLAVGVGIEQIYETCWSLHHYDYPDAGANAIFLGILMISGAVGIKASRSTVVIQDPTVPLTPLSKVFELLETYQTAQTALDPSPLAAELSNSWYSAPSTFPEVS